MALLTKDEAYSWLKALLRDGFETNDTTKTVSVKRPLSKDEIDGLLCDVVNIIGNKEMPHPKTSDSIKMLYRDFKLDPNRVPIDKDTLTIDKYGQIKANIDKITDNDTIVRALASNEEFIAKLRKYMEPEAYSAYQAGMLLLHSPVFMRMLTSIVSLIQKNDENDEHHYVETIIKNYFEDLEKYGDANKTQAMQSSSDREESSE